MPKRNAEEDLKTDDGANLFEQTLQSFLDTGVCSVSNAVTRTWTEAVIAFISGLNPEVKYGGLRVELSLSPSEPWFDPKLITEHAELAPLLRRMLGSSFSLVRVGGIMSFPGAEDQEIHRDGQPLFESTEMEGGQILPTHAVHVWIPVTPNYTKQAGATSFYLGTHKTFGSRFEDLGIDQGSAVSPIIPLGSCLIFDDRIFHFGGANETDAVRTCVFFSFARSWFTDGTAEADRNITAWTEIE